MKTAIIAVAGLATAAAAQIDIVVDDFDGGGQFISRVITPDNSGNNGAFSTSIFDVFGITNRTVNNDFADDSAGSFPPDTFGVLKTGKTDNVFGVEDLQNGDNSAGGGTATWTVDISGLTDLSIAIDFAAMGDMEGGDNSHLFRVSIDGGTAQTVFDIDSDDSAAQNYVLESGTLVTLNDPLFESISGTFLSNDFVTLSNSIAGTGSTLTIEYIAGINNGGNEVFVFDNIVVSGIPTPGAAAVLGLGGLVAARRRR